MSGGGRSRDVKFPLERTKRYQDEQEEARY